MIHTRLKLPRRRLSAAVALLVALLAVGGAWAYFSGAANGTAQASVGTLAAPSITSATPGAGTVALSWNPVSAPAGATTVRYYVIRDGGAPAGDCPASPASATTSTSCTDSAVNAGQHSYKVVAVWQSWTATSATTSVMVASLTPSSVAVVSGFGQAATVTTGFASSLVAVVKDAGGNPVPGVTVTFTAPASGASATFANHTATTTVTTAGNGQATAAGLSANTAAGNYTVTASVSGATSASFSLTNNPAAASTLAFTSQPASAASVPAGSSMSLGVSVEDQYGNVETGDNATTVTLALGSNPGSSTLSCTNPGGATVTVAAGVAGYSCSLNKPAQAYTLTAASSPAHGTATSNSFNVVLGSPATVAVSSGSGQSATINSVFSSALAAKVTDAGGNALSGATVTFTAPSSGASGTFSGAGATTTATTNSSGIASASAFTANSVAGAYSVTASAGGATSASFGLTNKPGAAAKLAFTQQPGGAAAGAAFITQPRVAVEDSAGNIVTTDATQVTLNIASGTPTSGGSNPQLKGCTAANSGGVTTFSACQITQSGQGYALTATGGSLTSANSSAFNVSNTASKLVFTTSPGGTITGGTSFSTQPVVTVQDSNGNTVYNDSRVLTLAITSGTGTSGATLSGCTQTETNGVVSFSGCAIDKAGTGYTLTATYGGQVTAATSSTFSVGAGSAAQLVLSAATTAPTAGTGDNLTISATDAGGNLATSYSGSHTLSFSGASNAPNGTAPTVSDNSGTDQTFGAGTPINFTNGVATASGAGNGMMKLYNAGSATIVATDGTLTSSGVAITVGTSAANKLAFVQQPAGATGGTAFTTQPKVAVQDQYGNTVTGNTSNVTLAIATNPSGGTLTCTTNPVAASSGLATFSGCKIDKTGTGYTLTATDAGLTSATSNAFSVAVGPAAKLAFTQQPGGGQAGSAFSVQPTVTVQDAGGNTVTTNTSNVTLAMGTNPGGGTLTCTTNPLAATNGVSSFAGCKINKPGNGYTLTAGATGLTGATSTTFNVIIGPASQLLVSAATTVPTAGAADALTITAQDAVGNTVTAYTGPHNLTFSGASNSPNATAPSVSDSSGTAQSFGSSTSLNFTAGVATVSGSANGVMKLYNAGSATIVVSDGTLTSSGLAVTVGIAPANRLAFVQQPAGATGGTPFTTQPKVAVQDTYGNTVTTSSAGVSLAIGTNPSGGILTCTTNPLAASSGVATFSGCKIDKAGTGYTLSASATGLAGTTSASFNVH